MHDIFDIYGDEKIKVVFTALDNVSEIRFIDKNLGLNEFLTWNNFTQKSVLVKNVNGVLYHKEISIL